MNDAVAMQERPDWSERQSVDQVDELGGADGRVLEFAAGVASAVRSTPGCTATAMIPSPARRFASLTVIMLSAAFDVDVADVAADVRGDLHRPDRRRHVDDPRPLPPCAAARRGAG